MRCLRCQHDNLADAVFCQECGARLEAPCPSCGEGNQPSAKFCRKCGQRLGGETPHPVAAPKFANPTTYTPPHLAEKILTSKSALEGERKQVTVLFADLKGSMELLADRDPEEARKLLDPVLERMMEAVHRYEGTVNQVMGDGIMALFGAPVAHEDHAVRACYAGLRMQESIKRYAEELHRTAGVPLHIRVGLNSGEVLVRSIGSDLHMDYTAVGQTTHLAARLEHMAMPGTILISPDTLRLAEGYVQVNPLGPRPVKGLGAPIEVFEVVGASAVRSRLHAAAARGLTRFVGREAELDQLHQALARARTGRGQVVAVVGEPGVGKSRLYWEFTHSHRTRGWLMVESGSVSYGKASAYLPVIDLLRAYFHIDARDEARTIHEKVTGKLLSLDRALEPSLPAFLWLLDAPVADPRWEQLDPPQRRQRTLDGAKHLLLRESQVQPLLVMFEDLHWIDAETQALLDSLVEALPTARVLLLVNYRPEYRHGWGNKTYYRQLLIDPLPRESADELLSTLLGADPTLDTLKRLLLERTEGNPFFLEESVRTLVEAQVLSGEQGAHRLDRPLEAVRVPTTVQAVLAGRIDRLPAEDKRLLQSASVVGHEVPFGLLQAVADLPEAALRQGLTRLHAGEFLYETQLFPDLHYTFKHALTHDVAYGSLLQERRKGLHAKVVEAIERLYPEGLTEHVERLAHHAFRAEVWDTAVSYGTRAGRRAMAQSAYQEAAKAWELAVAALGHLPETPDRVRLGIDLRLELRQAYWPLAWIDHTAAVLQEAASLAASIDDPMRQGHARIHLGLCYVAQKQFEKAIATLEPVSAAPHAASRDLAVAATYYLNLCFHAQGRYRRAVQAGDRGTGMIPADEHTSTFRTSTVPAANMRAINVASLAELGEFQPIPALVDETIAIVDATPSLYAKVLALIYCALAFIRQGKRQEAWAVLARLQSVPGGESVAITRARYLVTIGEACLRSGRAEDALATVESIPHAELLEGSPRGGTAPLIVVAEAYLANARPADAMTHAERALALTRQNGERGCEAWSLRLLGEIALTGHTLPHGDAAHWFRHGIALAGQLDMRPLAAHCRLGLGKALRQAGRQPDGDREIEIATAEYRAMDMPDWLEQARSTLITP